MTTPDKTRRIIEECEASGEPYVVFRAQDALAPMAVAYYLTLVEKYAPMATEIQEGMVAKNRELIGWPGPRKYPD